MRCLAFAMLLAASGLCAATLPAIADDGERPFRATISIVDPNPIHETIHGVTYTSEGATGEASHLGRVSGPIFYSPATYKVDPVHGPELLFYGFGSFTAANGDQLTFSFDDAFVLLTTNAQGNYPTGFTATITGGTGRFANASGELFFLGYVLPQGAGFGPTYFDVAGSISYDDSGH